MLILNYYIKCEYLTTDGRIQLRKMCYGIGHWISVIELEIYSIFTINWALPTPLRLCIIKPVKVESSLPVILPLTNSVSVLWLDQSQKCGYNTLIYKLNCELLTLYQPLARHQSWQNLIWTGKLLSSHTFDALLHFKMQNLLLASTSFQKFTCATLKTSLIKTCSN